MNSLKQTYIKEHANLWFTIVISNLIVHLKDDNKIKKTLH